MRYSSRLFLYAPFLLLLVLGIAAALRWWSVSDAFVRRLDEANRGHEIAPGVTLHFDSEQISGFPFNIDAVLQDVTLKVDAPRGPFVWHTGHFALHALTYGRPLEIFEAAGPQNLIWTDGNGQIHRFSFVPGSLRASAIAADGRLARFDLDIAALGSADLSTARVQLHVRHAADRNALDVFLSIDVLHLPPALQSVLGADVARLTVEGRFTRATEFLPLLAGSETWTRATENWRRTGGKFELDPLEIASAKLQARAGGKLSLDSLHRIEGTLDTRLAGESTIAAQDSVKNRFGAALMRLTKDASPHAGEPIAFSIRFQSGNVSLWKKSEPPQAAGSISPVY